MDRDPEVAAILLRKQLLLAQCELDRREAEADFNALRDRIHAGAATVRRSAPWILAGAPVAGFVLSRLLGRGRSQKLFDVARVAFRFRNLWPLVGGLLASVGARGTLHARERDQGVDRGR